jgi:hypothetical protein
MREHIFDPDDRDLHTHDRQRTRANFSYDPTGLPLTLPNETRQYEVHNVTFPHSAYQTTPLSF